MINDIVKVIASLGGTHFQNEVDELQSSSPTVRYFAVGRLGKEGKNAAPILPILVEILKNDTDKHVRAAAIEAIRKIAKDKVPEATKILIDVLNSPDSGISALAAVQHFKEIKSPANEIMPALISTLSNNKDVRVRINATSLIGDYKEEALPAVPALMTALNDNDQMLRSVAALSLGETKSQDSSVIEALYATLNDKKRNEYYVRSEAALAIAKIVGYNNREVINDLHQKLLEIRDAAVRTGMPWDLANKPLILFQKLADW